MIEKDNDSEEDGDCFDEEMWWYFKLNPHPKESFVQGVNVSDDFTLELDMK